MTAIRIIDDHLELAGLGDDDHTQYPLLAGRAGGQTLIGGITTIADLTLQTTSGVGATGADMHFLVGNNGATEAMTILNNGRVGIGTTSPAQKLDVSGKIALDGTTVAYRPTGMTGTLILGDGGTNLSHTTGSEGFYNTFIGIGAGTANTTGNYNTANGINSLYSNTTGNYNTANGMNSLYSNTTGYRNTANGMYSLYSNTIGNSNTANGMYSIHANTTGYYNTANGMYSIHANTTGNYNTANGMYSLHDLGAAQTAGAFNIGTSYTIKTVGDTDFTAIGASANTVGIVFTASGAGTGTGTGTPNATNSNTAFGYNTGRGIIYGTGNTILGANVTGLDAGLTNNIILADGAGNRRVNIDSSGNVGIGDTSPNQLLGLKGTNAQISVEESDTEFLRVGVGETAGTTVIGWDDADALQLGLYSSPTDTTIDPKMTILADGKVGIATITPTAILDVNSDILRLRTAKTPATAGAAGNQGDICGDDNYIYRCISTNVWKRAGLVSW